MGILTLIAPYIPSIIKMVNGAIRGENKGPTKLDAAANLADILLRSIDPNNKLDGDVIKAGIQTVFDQMKSSGEVDGPKEANHEKYYLIRASKIQEM
jgi:hypothetical protein